MNIDSKKLNVALIYGGNSVEHYVSIESAKFIINNLDKKLFSLIPIYISPNGKWKVLQSNNDEFLLQNLIATVPDNIGFPLATLSDIYSTNYNNIDIAFSMIHGQNGEDGSIQGLFELMNIPYVGAGILSSAISLDKEIAKIIAQRYGIDVAPYIAYTIKFWIQDKKKCIEEILDKLKIPLFVKPASSGSSVGVTKVAKLDELESAIEEAFLYDNKILIEEAIDAREIELSLLENEELYNAPLVSVPGEIISNQTYYSFEAKYVDPEGASLSIPAHLTSQETKEAQIIAIKIFEALQCEGMARVDLFLDKKTNKFLFNEVNTIPGFTEISMYPKLWQHSGVSYKELITKLLNLALRKHKNKVINKNNISEKLKYIS